MIVIPAELGDMPVIGIAEGALTYYWGEIAFEADLPRISNKDGFLIDTLTSTLLYSAPSSVGQPLPPVCRLGKGCTINWVTGWGEMDVIIPEGVEEIAAYAFYDWEAKSLTLPESLRLIETCAFESFNVVDLPIVIPEGVQEVQYGAFGLTYQVGEWGLYETPDMIVERGDGTHYETYEEYVARTGDDSWEIE
nr:leucine-rich repeat protein [Clostridia bacterium]